jgi:hypothetical protein
VANFSTVYPTNFLLIGNVSGFLAGDPNAFVILFSGPDTIISLLPAPGQPGAPLNASLIDPVSTSAGDFAGEMTVLRLNIDFSDAGVLHGTAALQFGDVRICGLSSRVGLNGLTVRQFLDLASTALSGGATQFRLADLDLTTNNLNGAFGGGGVRTFAQQNSVNGACP